jgi:hypothetical protein
MLRSLSAIPSVSVLSIGKPSFDKRKFRKAHDFKIALA